MIDISKVVVKLANKRPIFHSEADFQHALAWEIHQLCPEYSMRLEFKPPNLNNRFYIDIWATYGGSNVAIELKYKTCGLKVEFKGEKFNLLNQSAQDVGRYDFLKDIQRLEQIVSIHKNVVGYSMLLTNDNTYWSTPRNNRTVDASFRIHQDKVVTGRLNWGRGASEGTKHYREKPIFIRAHYKMNWKDYSEPSKEKYGKLRYLLLEIKNN